MPRLNASALTLISGILLLSACASGPPTGEVMELPVFPPAPEEARFYYERSLISTADVEIESGEARLERMLTGVTRTGIGMSKPFAVSVHQGRVFVSDTVQRMVWAFDVRAGKFFEIGVDGGGVDRGGEVTIGFTIVECQEGESPPPPAAASALPLSRIGR